MCQNSTLQRSLQRIYGKGTRQKLSSVMGQEADVALKDFVEKPFKVIANVVKDPELQDVLKTNKYSGNEDAALAALALDSKVENTNRILKNINSTLTKMQTDIAEMKPVFDKLKSGDLKLTVEVEPVKAKVGFSTDSDSGGDG